MGSELSLEQAEKRFPFRVQVIAWLSPAPPSNAASPPVLPEAGWRRLFKPAPAGSAPPGSGVPAQPPKQPGQLGPAVVINDPQFHRIRTVRRRGVPASQLLPNERKVWEDLIVRHYDVHPDSYVFLCYFPCIPDLNRLPHHFDLGRQEVQMTLPGEGDHPLYPTRLMILQDLRTGSLIRISQPLLADEPL